MPQRHQTFHRPAALLLFAMLLVACSVPGAPETSQTDTAADQPADLPEHCTLDGAVQSWLLLPADPPRSGLMDAYQTGEIIDFQAMVIGSDDNPALQPHRRFMLRDAAEGIVLWLDYQGDPPPLVQGLSYRFVAWADFAPPPATTPTPSADPRAAIPDALRFEMQIYDTTGLLFVGSTDVQEQDPQLGLTMKDARGDCPALPPPSNACVKTRRVLPLAIEWGDGNLTLYPGEDGEIVRRGVTYTASLFRNRQVTYADPPCDGYTEYARSLRIDRLEPPPLSPTLIPTPRPAPVIVPTVPITTTAPITP